MALKYLLGHFFINLNYDDYELSNDIKYVIVLCYNYHNKEKLVIIKTPKKLYLHLVIGHKS